MPEQFRYEVRELFLLPVYTTIDEMIKISGRTPNRLKRADKNELQH